MNKSRSVLELKELSDVEVDERDESERLPVPIFVNTVNLSDQTV